MTLEIFEAGCPPEISHSYQKHGFYKMYLLSNMAIFWVSIFWFSGGVGYIPFPQATPSFFGTAQFVKFLSENLQRHLDQLIERLKSVP